MNPRLALRLPFLPFPRSPRNSHIYGFASSIHVEGMIATSASTQCNTREALLTELSRALAMTQTSFRRSRKAHNGSEHPSHNVGKRTVAALGIEARLVPAEPDLQHEFSRLIASCETLVDECERLFCCVRRIIEDGARDRASHPQNSSR